MTDERNITRSTIDSFIGSYLKLVDSMQIATCGADVVDFIRRAKRDPVGCGPYPSVSMFESFNRILSDFVLLFGVRRLLQDSISNVGSLPYDRYKVALGHEGGNDLCGFIGDASIPGLVGEAFNASRAYAQQKRREATAKVLAVTTASHRAVLLNAEVLRRPEHFIARSKASLFYILVDVPMELSMFRARPDVDPEEFWKPAPVASIAQAQGIAAPQPLQELVGQGASLWENDEAFKRFLGGPAGGCELTSH